MMRRPLAGLATGFAVGVALGLAAGNWPAAAAGWVVTALFWLAAGRSARLARLSGIATLLVALTTGWLTASRAADLRRAEIARLKATAAGGLVTLSGAVSGDVEVRALAHGGATYRFALRQVVQDSSAGAHRISRLPVSVTWYGPSPEDAALAVWHTPASGERWRFTGTLKLRSGTLRKMRATLIAREQGSARIAEASLYDGATLADRARQVTAARLARGIETWGPIPALVQAMFLGTCSEIPRDLNQIFRDSGTVHIFAISGMNVALLAVVLIALLGVLGVPRTWWCLPLAPLLIFYTVVTGFSASALRACLMAILYFGAPLLGRRPDGVSTLAAAAVIALGIDPFQLQDAGFALSFVVMGGLLLIDQPLAVLLKRAWRVDDATLEARAMSEQGGELEPGAARARRWHVVVRRYLAEGVAMSLAAWLSSAPLTAWYFGRLTPGSLLANLPIAPAAFFVGVASSVGLAVGLVSSWAEAVFNSAAGGITLLMIWTARAAVAIPGGAFTISKPPLWGVGCWYVVLLMLTAILWRLARPLQDGGTWMERAAQEQGRTDTKR